MTNTSAGLAILLIALVSAALAIGNALLDPPSGGSYRPGPELGVNAQQ